MSTDARLLQSEDESNVTATVAASRRRTASKRYWATVLGVIVALVTCEVALRPFARGVVDLPEPSAEYRPSRAAIVPFKEERQFLEGVAVSHFAADGARLTGQHWIAPAKVGLILGDSFVQAVQVGDSATMGAVIEQLARNSGHPLNVRQYGWSGAGISSYLALANSMSSEWHPSWIVLVLNTQDLITALDGDSFFQMQVESNGYKLIPIPRTSVKLERVLTKFGLHAQDLRRSVEVSTLAFLGIQRFELIREATDTEQISTTPKPSETPPADIARTAKVDDDRSKIIQALHALRMAYGNRLLIVYLPTVDMRTTAKPSRAEAQFLEECPGEGVPCLSLRSGLVKERDERDVLPEGFSNTIPGQGHLNIAGHHVAGTEIWRKLAELGW